MTRGSSLRARLAVAKTVAPKDVTERARGGLLAFVDAMKNRPVIEEIASGRAAQGIGRVGLSGMKPHGLACAEGCAFCCILSGADGGTITEAEARELHAALQPVIGEPDGRDWHRRACAALDPRTRTCRAYDARPVICRAYVSTDVTACEKVAEGQPAEGPGTLAPYHSYLAALGLSRAALKGTRRVATYALARLTAAAVAGQTVEEALHAARHKPAELDAELKRSKRDLARARGPGLP